MKFFHEVRTDVVRVGPPIIKEIGEVIPPSEYNFRSTFDYPETVANDIIRAGTTAGLKGRPLSCTTIYIDVDEHDFVDEARDILLGQGVTFEEYKTGNRGCHFHIPLSTRITGTDTLYTVTAWLKDVGLWEFIDSSVYREGGQFRMESATHQKTGKTKVMTNEFDGELLELDIKATPKKTVNPMSIDVTGDVRNFHMNLLQRRGVGGRHLHIYILWQSGKEAGLSEDVIESAILEWNAAQDEPHSEQMMMKKIGGFR